MNFTILSLNVYSYLTLSAKLRLSLIANNRTQAGYTAQAILENVLGVSFEPVLEEIEESSPRNSIPKNNTASNELPQLNIKPNPANDFVDISILKDDYNSQNEVTIYDIKGQEIYKKIMETGNSSITFDINKLPTGYYIVQVKDMNGKILTTSFIK